MNSPEKLLSAFSDYVDERHAARFYRYAGYTRVAGSLLIKVKDTDNRILIRPWLRSGPVGLKDIRRSDKRYSRFRGQEPDIHVNLATSFRQNAIRYARSNDKSSLIAYEPEQRAVNIIASSSLPKMFLDAFLSFCSENKLSATYDFTGTLAHKGFKGNVAQADRVSTHARNPSLFLSYSWDSDSHRHWVLKLAAELIRNGVKVLIDEWDLRDYDDDLNRFMETGIRESDYVVLVCTPDYAKRANDRKGGVGVESTIITGEFYNPSRALKFVPILRNAKGGPQSCLPSYLKSRYAIDFTTDSDYQSKLEELLRRVFRKPRYRKPELGPIPPLDSEDV